ncbi:MAG: glycoside hydrolase [Acidobacteriales bacterium]|nr:glycoside hydrolase [Terriglobales bacterium]
MSKPLKKSLMLAVPVTVLALLVFVFASPIESEYKGKAKLRRKIDPDVVNSAAGGGAVAAAAPASGFSAQTRLGFTAGDQWEPAIATDRSGRVYILYPQYKGVPGCATCPNPTMILQVSNDRGSTWSAPRPIAQPAGPVKTGQYDAQIVVDPVDGKTVYAAWLQNSKSDIAVAKSTDFGSTWSVVIADSTNAGTDKPILAVRGPNVYVGYNHSQTVWASYSHDGGHTFTSVKVNDNGKLGWSLAGGGAVDQAGNVYFSWSGYEQNGGAKGNVNLFVSRSFDGGATWSSTVVDVSAAPPDCSDYFCGWAFLGAQMTMASEGTGILYGLWNSGTVDKGPERIFFAKSTDAGVTWSRKVDVSDAVQGIAHAFPAIIVAEPGDVRISWMDARNAPMWNAYYRRSRDGGKTWSSESDISTFVPGFSYITPEGFSFPFGDYYEMDIDDQGTTQVIMGQGLNWDSPGSIWYTRGK